MDVGVVDMSDGGLRVRASAPVPCGTPVKIDGNHTLMLGEVCRCVPEEGAYTVGIQLTCTLSSFAELEQLDRALVGEQRVWEVESPSRIT